MDIVLQSVSGIFGLTNKVFLLLGKRAGWIFGFFAGVSFAVYYLFIDLKILGIVQIGLTMLMIYGYIVHKKISKGAHMMATLVLSMIAITLLFATFKNSLTIIETLSVLSGCWATYLIAQKKYRSGWLVFLIAHITSAYLTFLKSEYIFFSFQIFSAIVAICGVLKPTTYIKKSL